jgi:Ulp1 family protease
MAQVLASFRKPPGTVLFKAFRHAFSVAEFQQLRQGNCLQDDIVKHFIQLLQERCALLGDRVWIAQTFF